MTPHLSLVADAGRRVEAPPRFDLSADASASRAAAAFVQTLELALRQAARLADDPAQTARLRRLCRVVLDQSSAALALTEEDAQWTIEPFVGA